MGPCTIRRLNEGTEIFALRNTAPDTNHGPQKPMCAPALTYTFKAGAPRTNVNRIPSPNGRRQTLAPSAATLADRLQKPSGWLRHRAALPHLTFAVTLSGPPRKDSGSATRRHTRPPVVKSRAAEKKASKGDPSPVVNVNVHVNERDQLPSVATVFGPASATSASYGVSRKNATSASGRAIMDRVADTLAFLTVPWTRFRPHAHSRRGRKPHQRSTGSHRRPVKAIEPSGTLATEWKIATSADRFRVPSCSRDRHAQT